MNKNIKGFSLIEVLIALSILMTGIVMLARFQTQLLHQDIKAHQILQMKIRLGAISERLKLQGINKNEAFHHWQIITNEILPNSKSTLGASSISLSFQDLQAELKL